MASGEKHGSKQGLAPAWRKGQSGNPKGRPRKEECLTSLLKAEIEKMCPQDKEKRTWKELLVIATMKLAMAGNSTALKEVWERVDGKVKQDVDLNGQLSGAMSIRVEYVGD